MIPTIAPSRASAYERISVATFATHDHKPLRALWEEAFEKHSDTTDQARHDLAKIAEFAGLAPPNELTNYLSDFYPAILDALFRSESWIAIVMITDLLGRKDRFNVPGTETRSNWTRRLHTTVEQTGRRSRVTTTASHRARAAQQNGKKSGHR